MPSFADHKMIFHSRGSGDATLYICYQDTASDTKYYGYEGQDGFWMIQRFVASTGVYTYYTGTSDIATNWAIRATFTYILPSALS